MLRIALAATLSCLCGAASAYDTGGLTCERIGEAAVDTLAAKRAGRDHATQVASLESTVAPDAQVERKLLTNVVRLIYRNDLIDAMEPRDIFIVFFGDCTRGKALDAR